MPPFYDTDVDNVTAYCVYNKGCVSAHAELFKRDTLIGFSKKVKAGDRECCDPNSSGCVQGTRDDLLLWIDCDTGSRKRTGPGQGVVGCAECDINILESGMIEVVVANGKNKGKVLSIYACKGIDAGLSPATDFGSDEL
ncbi:hypothetical protein TYRP_015959 [Tyrophagus putrescentiae]|nr:hypothetical protein TYRP_015959 [Tyrophagus putrescentiae]